MNSKSINLTLIFLSASFILIAQNEEYTDIKGEIINSSLNSIAFVNIVSQKTFKKSISDEDGKFTIHVMKDDTIFFSTISYQTKKIAVSRLNKENNYVVMDSLIYELSKVDIMAIRRAEMKQKMIETKLTYIEQKILVLPGLPDPYKELIPVKPNLLLNPVTTLYEVFKKESRRKRKQTRWNNIYQKSLKENEQQIEKDTLYLPKPVKSNFPF